MHIARRAGGALLLAEDVPLPLQPLVLAPRFEDLPLLALLLLAEVRERRSVGAARDGLRGAARGRDRLAAVRALPGRP